MIRFICKQCGKFYERPEDAAGTLVFCDCGVGNRVPWESTAGLAAPAPEATAETAAPLPAARLVDEKLPWSPSRGRGRRRQIYEARQRDPAFCFNHQDRPRQQTCAACGEGFCPDCMVVLQGATLCGPCKNFRIRSLQRAPQVSVPAILSLLFGLLTGPLGLCLSGAAAQAKSPLVGLVGLFLPVVGLVLGAKALRDIETRPLLRGRSLAIAGLVSSLIAGFLAVVWLVLVERQMD
jgi:Domain of unknown function (DUF4190)